MHVEEVFSQADDLAAKYPQKVKQMQDLFLKEAKKYNILPLDDRFAERTAANRPSLTRGRQSFTYYPGAVRLPAGSAPSILNRSYTITAWVDNPDGKAEGVLATHGGKFGGYGLFVQNGKPTFAYNWGQSARYTISATEPLPAGKSTIRFDFAYDGGKPGAGGTGTIFVNDRKVAEGRIERTMMMGYSFDETFDVGEDSGLHRQTGEGGRRAEVMADREESRPDFLERRLSAPQFWIPKGEGLKRRTLHQTLEDRAPGLRGYEIS